MTWTTDRLCRLSRRRVAVNGVQRNDQGRAAEALVFYIYKYPAIKLQPHKTPTGKSIHSLLKKKKSNKFQLYHLKSDSADVLIY